jgi:NAD(P)-dependent dehydrogenase (short-subunit alcohol dehydrogenase family)
MPIAIVTGASKGLGRAIAADLVADGWDVVIDARSADELEATAAALDGAPGQVRALPGDVTDADHRAALVAVAAELGGLDLLVNNASALGPTPLPGLATYPLEALSAVLATNVVAPLGLVQLALPLLLERAGTVVDVSSDAAVEGYEGWGGYGASKAALDQLTNVLAAEHPTLRAYAVDPGDMRTQMHQDAFPGEDISDRPAPESVVPAIRRLLELAPPSGRYKAADIGLVSTASGADR